MKTLLRLVVAIFVLCFFTKPAFAQETLFVNEIMASNNTGITDATGAHEDWFEIYNPSDHVVDIAGYYFSDKTNTPTKYKMPTGHAETVIQPHGFLLIWASEKVDRGPLHVNFALSASGENVVISAPNGTLIDAVTFGAQTTDYSYGRYPDGSNTWSLFSTTTPGASNAGGTTYQPKLAAPVFSVPGGFKTAAFQLSITHPEPGVIIRYTTDGSEPVESNSPEVWNYKNKYKTFSIDGPGIGLGLLDERNQTNQYVSPIQIVDRSSTANRISMKSSTYSNNPTYFPDASIYKGTVIRAKAFKTGSIPSETVTKTYFISPAGGGRYSLPVISLVSDEKSFFDYTTGIYNAGKKYDEFMANPFTVINGCTIANYTQDGDEWERRGSFEFFDQGNAVFSQDNIGFRIHGNCSRLAPQKTLRIYSDTRFDYNFFPGRTAIPKRLLLRGNGNEPTGTSIKDLLAQQMVDNLTFDSQKSKPSVMFINGEYWGIQSVRERYDKYYLEDKYNVDKDNVDLIQVLYIDGLPTEAKPGYEAETGDVNGYKELLDFVANNALDDATNYEKLKTMIDLENYTDYQITQMFINDVDWPRQNIRLWRTKTTNNAPGAPNFTDGRWRWMLFDCDYAFLYSNSNDFPGAGSGPGSPVLFKKLLLNQDYKKLISSRIADLLNTHFITERSIGIFEQLRAIYAPLMPEYINRWKEKTGGDGSIWNTVQSIEKWNGDMDALKNFLNDRPAGFRNSVRTTFGSELIDFILRVDVSDESKGYIKVNSIDITPATTGVAAHPYPWAGYYFQTIPVKLVAIPKAGNHFLRWEGPNGFTSHSPTLTVTSTNDDLTFTAVFENDPGLAALTMSQGQLSPSFDATKTAYSATVQPSAETVTVTPTMSGETIKIEVSANDGEYTAVENNAASGPLAMLPGYNVIRIKVTGSDEVTVKIYSIVVNRLMSPPGNSLTFDGVDDYITVDNNSLGNFRQNAFTIEMYVRTTRTTGAGSVLNKRNVCNVASYVDMIINDGKLKFASGSNNEGLNYNAITGSIPVADGKWHHIAVTRAGTLISLYVDGKLDVAFTATGVADIDNSINADPIKIGNSVCNNIFSGSIDELRIWDVAKTQTELQAARFGPLSLPAANLLAYYNFDIGRNETSPVFTDLGGSGKHGTLHNFDPASSRAESYAMVVPVSAAASQVSVTEFTANWSAPTIGTAERYFLDVSTSETFSPGNFLTGFQALEVTGTTQKVTLPQSGPGRQMAGTNYYYRVSADKTSVTGQGSNSETVTVTDPLPVKLISFVGKSVENVNLLEWIVTDEKEFDGYEVERSFDARSFERIGIVKARSNEKSGSTGYEYTDQSAQTISFQTNYYRLKMLDLDGSFAYSRMVAINQAGRSSISIYPNPTGETVNIQVTDNRLNTHATLCDISGRVLQTLLITKNQQQLNVKRLASGLYMLRFADGTVERFVKE